MAYGDRGAAGPAGGANTGEFGGGRAGGRGGEGGERDRDAARPGPSPGQLAEGSAGARAFSAGRGGEQARQAQVFGIAEFDPRERAIAQSGWQRSTPMATPEKQADMGPFGLGLDLDVEPEKVAKGLFGMLGGPLFGLGMRAIDALAAHFPQSAPGTPGPGEGDSAMERRREEAAAKKTQPAPETPAPTPPRDDRPPLPYTGMADPGNWLAGLESGLSDARQRIRRLGAY